MAWRSQFLWDGINFEILIWESFNEQDQDLFKFGSNELEWSLHDISCIISFKAVFTFPLALLALTLMFKKIYENISYVFDIPQISRIELWCRTEFYSLLSFLKLLENLTWKNLDHRHHLQFFELDNKKWHRTLKFFRDFLRLVLMYLKSGLMPASNIALVRIPLFLLKLWPTLQSNNGWTPT